MSATETPNQRFSGYSYVLTVTVSDWVAHLYLQHAGVINLLSPEYHTGCVCDFAFKIIK